MNLNRQVTAPVDARRSNRNWPTINLTSLPAGRIVPLAFIPILREDSMSGRFQCTFEMMETAEILMNPVNVDFHVHLVPWLCMERFEGDIGQLNRSFMGEAQTIGGDVVPFFEFHKYGVPGADDIYVTAGLHEADTANVNTMYAESYNAMVEWRYKNISPDLIPNGRDRLTRTLAASPWRNNRLSHIVPDFDQAKNDGEILLELAEERRMRVHGIGLNGAVQTRTGVQATRQPGAYHDGEHFGQNVNQDGYFIKKSSDPAAAGTQNLHVAADAAGFPEIWTELQEGGIRLTLANIELATKTRAWAEIRQRYSELPEEWAMDMLMRGIAIPDQHLKQPILLAHQQTQFGMSKRYATDGDNLAKSAVNGATQVSATVAVPRLNTGGVVIVTAEIAPEQVFERSQDPFFSLSGVEDLPDYMRDDLDPEKIEVVSSNYVDTDHDFPERAFGFAPLNFKWNANGVRLGGKFHRRKADDGFDEDRNRVWAVETVNPVLGADFYLTSAIHTKPFLVTNQDPFEALLMGNCVVNGLTVFGGALIEATDDYQKVEELAREVAPRIDKSTLADE